MINLTFGHIELFVQNPLAALKFYQDKLGAMLVVNQNDHFIWVKIGAQELLLRSGKPPDGAPTYSQSRVAMVLYTEELETAVSYLQGSGVLCHPMPNEPECFTFQDPDGNWFQLVDPSSH